MHREQQYTNSRRTTNNGRPKRPSQRCALALTTAGRPPGGAISWPTRPLPMPPVKSLGVLVQQRAPQCRRRYHRSPPLNQPGPTWPRRSGPAPPNRWFGERLRPGGQGVRGGALFGERADEIHRGVTFYFAQFCGGRDAESTARERHRGGDWFDPT